jgi:hypothetical protein
MKENTITPYVLGFTLLLFIGGCTSTSPPDEVPNPVPAHRVLSTLTATVTVMPTLAITPTLLETTPISTATTEERRNLFREFMSHNGSCRLPCWWHVTPGQAWEDAEKTIQGLGGALVPGIPGYDPETTTYGTSITVKNIIPDGTISLEEKQGLVHAWHISSTGGVDNPEEFRRFWKNYLAQKIVTMYGMPDRILLHGDPAPNALQYGLYSLWLFYDELGFSILYEARIPKYFFDAPFFRICSETDPLLNIEINTQSPDNFLPLDRFDRTLEQVRLVTDMGKLIVIRSLQEATGLDDTEIYDTFLQNEVACFAIPSDIWSPRQR